MDPADPFAMNRISTGEGKAWILAVCQAVTQARDELSAIDGAIGDGDHGINMAKGFRLAMEELDGKACSFEESLDQVAGILMGRIGGSMGPLYGMFFKGMAREAAKADYLDAAQWAALLQGARQAIGRVSPARPGDKTLVDVLQPAAEAAIQAAEQHQDLGQALSSTCKAARSGLDSTREMQARLGRASRLGERSRGHLDPGAASCCLILETLSSVIAQHLQPGART